MLFRTTDRGAHWTTISPDPTARGASWSDVTPKDVPVWAKISTIDVSAIDLGAAYIAVDNHRQDDFTPRAYKTKDYGRRWTATSSSADCSSRGPTAASTFHSTTA